MNAKEHYENHLASFYSWMIGNFDQKRADLEKFIIENEIYPTSTKVAIDLGAGTGVQAIALSNLGFNVTAVDFNQQLLSELTSNDESNAINTVQADVRDVKDFESLQPELIVCCGDTITHLPDKPAVEKLLLDCESILTKNGKLILSFRDYSAELTDQQRFISVKSDENQILTCILEYTPDKVKVTDLLYEKENETWNQKVSTYEKVRLSAQDIVNMIEQTGMKVIFNRPVDRMQTIIANK
ncbi:class I SAM-dependent methyltransferase [Tunicatimonas pelagia]|uniref:class I SAM-dependent methyltransferase n=1 Tax=Tunicatimonas pelagia TaxID=931531 RepID=UPI0026654F89|nr:class I SAM-dependent methyltransferase [Tunicatimonas pelagia]WKN40516.1 class I SAM-dependent methyltransferase [Tunicatimonas pelagia]